MRRISLILATILLAFVGVACDAFRTISKNAVISQGAPYELIIVANQPLWEGELGETLRDIFAAPIPYLQQQEPHFDILRVTESGYTNLVTRHRNIVVPIIDPSLSSASADVEYNKEATPQIVMTISAPTEEALIQYLDQYREEIVAALEGAERDRDIEYAKNFGTPSLTKLIESKFGFEMRIPKGYTLRNEGDDFVWISYEYPTASQGVLIYSYPSSQGALSLSREALVAARNRFAAKIPGPADGSYMTTFEEFTPQYKTFRLEGRLWAEMHGLWEVEGDFMGGPFVSFSTINTTTGEVVTIDAYVYSPKLGKRNFVRGVEHLIHNVSFEDQK